MNKVHLRLAIEQEAELVNRLQVESFMPLYEKYQDDDTSPVKESVDITRWKITDAKSDFYVIYMEQEAIGGVRIAARHGDAQADETIRWISPIFILPQYQNQGVGKSVNEMVFELYLMVKLWKLDTIKSETANCHLYEKCGFVRIGIEKEINARMTIGL